MDTAHKNTVHKIRAHTHACIHNYTYSAPVGRGETAASASTASAASCNMKNAHSTRNERGVRACMYPSVRACVPACQQQQQPQRHETGMERTVSRPTHQHIICIYAREQSALPLKTTTTAAAKRVRLGRHAELARRIQLHVRRASRNKQKMELGHTLRCVRTQPKVNARLAPDSQSTISRAHLFV